MGQKRKDDPREQGISRTIKAGQSSDKGGSQVANYELTIDGQAQRLESCDWEG